MDEGGGCIQISKCSKGSVGNEGHTKAINFGRRENLTRIVERVLVNNNKKK
jgi:hypothetical protein